LRTNALKRCILEAMKTLLQRHRGDALTEPSWSLRFAAVVIWEAVVYRAWMELHVGAIQVSTATWCGFGALILFGFLFAAPRIYRRCGERLRDAALLVSAATVLVAYALLQDVSVAILLAVVAAQFAYAYKAEVSLLLLVIINGILAWLFAQHFSESQTLENIVFFGALQLFTFLTATYAQNARKARESAIRANAELLATRDLLRESTRLDERLRITRELHDLAGYHLMALKLQLRQLAKHPQPADEAVIRQCAQLADAVLADVRGVVRASRYGEGIDLTRSLATLVNGLAWSGIDLHLDENVKAASLDQANALLRAAQEGLTNAIRYANAEHILL
jgi:signal transduction histidine kinase